jgi:hypothetical protein
MQLVKRGITRVPDLVKEFASYSEVAPRQNLLPEAVAHGANPPTLQDFLDDRLSAEVLLPMTRKAVVSRRARSRSRSSLPPRRPPPSTCRSSKPPTSMRSPRSTRPSSPLSSACKNCAASSACGRTPTSSASHRSGPRRGTCARRTTTSRAS